MIFKISRKWKISRKLKEKILENYVFDIQIIMNKINIKITKLVY